MITWYSIDTAGKLFPSVASQGNSSFFRVAAVLKEPVDRDIFQKAIERVRPRFSFFFVRLRQGIFWNYLEENYEPFLVQEEIDCPCIASSFGRHDSQLIRFLYFGNRLSIELFHSITDGSAAIEFLKAILFAYSLILAEKKNESVLPESEGKIVNIQGTPVIDDYENSFLRFTRMNRKGAKLEIRNFAPNSYHINGTMLPGNYIGVITGVFDSAQLNKYARSLDATITGYLVALLIYSIYSARLKFSAEKKPVVVSVPVNLRKQFPSATFRNFFAIANISFSFYDNSYENSEELFRSIIRSVTIQLKKLTGKENMQREIDKNIFFDRNSIGRWVPLKIKHLFVRQGFNLLGETKKTISLSNMGEMSLPSGTAPLVAHAETLLYPTPRSPINCSVVSVNGIMSVSFTKSIEETDIIRSFFMLFKQQTGLSVMVYSNDIER